MPRPSAAHYAVVCMVNRAAENSAPDAINSSRITVKRRVACIHPEARGLTQNERAIDRADHNLLVVARLVD